MLAVVIWLHISPLSVSGVSACADTTTDCSAATDVTNAVIEKLARPYHTPGTSRYRVWVQYSL